MGFLLFSLHWRLAMAEMPISQRQRPATEAGRVQVQTPGRGGTKSGIRQTKYICEGTYRNNSANAEEVLTVECPQIDSKCKCENTKIDCGGSSKQADDGYTLMEKTCKKREVIVEQ